LVFVLPCFVLFCFLLSSSNEENMLHLSFWYWVFRLQSMRLRQARSRESSGLICRLPRDGPNHPHLARSKPCPSPLIDYWIGLTWVLPSHRLE
jgi:hypothetical protein